MPAKDTTKLLVHLRKLMLDTSLCQGGKLSAYIIPSSDAHSSEYLSPKDERRQFITGFTGSYGTALVTHEKALLWVDGRYFLQAAQQLDSNWQLMKEGLPETPSIADWLCSNMPQTTRVGVDATLYAEDLYLTLKMRLDKYNVELTHVETNLVDMVWTEYDKPKLDLKPLLRLDTKLAGKSTRVKLVEIREQMEKLKTSSLVVTSLDEIAWLFNLRGHDIPFGTTFFAYCVVGMNFVKLFTHLSRLNEEIKSYLVNEEANIEFYEYDTFYAKFKEFAQEEYGIPAANNLSRKIYLSSMSNHAIHSLIPNTSLIFKETSYLNKLKVIKNSCELEASKRAHIRDSAVLCEFFYSIQKHFDSTTPKNMFDFELNEFSLAMYIDQKRMNQFGCMSPSFETICSVDANSAVIHYKPVKGDENTKKIQANNILLLDSGGHYMGDDMGTTDVTRTVFLGDTNNITSYHRECFTRVLKGHIALARKIFPSGTSAEFLDSFAREHLWQVGLDYRHGKRIAIVIFYQLKMGIFLIYFKGTGHGVGALLNVHEMPIITHRKCSDITLQKNMIVTIEPGYYEEGKFGIRIENCVYTSKAETKYLYANNVSFLKFEPLTYVPIQREFIDKELLSKEELDWLNNYHINCLTYVGEELKRVGKLEVLDWLIEQTKPL
jgi:Xaa-Pro aminopeptidase